MPVSAAGWRFDLSSRPFDPAEVDALGSDLASLGADATLLRVFEATVSVGSRWTRPRILRGSLGGRTAGAAVLMICRDTGPSFFSGPRARRTLRLAPPIWYWERVSLGTDGHAGPGVVAPGVSREEFAEAAIGWLARRFAVGVVVESAGEPRRVPHVPWPGLGVSAVPVADDGAGVLLAAHRNLGRKLRRFAARNGRIETVAGEELPTGWHRPLLAAYAVPRPLNPPFGELYPRMVAEQWRLPAARLVHLVALVGDTPVGYHTYWRTGRRLALLSGAFTRPAGGTAHAYENVLVASLEAARGLGCRLVDFGPTVNGVKSSLLGSAPTELRFVSRIAPLRGSLRALLPRTQLAQHRITAATGLELAVRAPAR